MLPLVVFKWVFWSFFLSFKFSFSLKWNRPCLPNCNLLVHLHKGLHRNTREANLKCAFPHAEAFSSNSHLNTPPHTRTTHTPHTPHTPPPPCLAPTYPLQLPYYLCTCSSYFLNFFSLRNFKSVIFLIFWLTAQILSSQRKLTTCPIQRRPSLTCHAKEGFLISPCYSLELCIQMLISFLCSFAFCFSSFHSYL